MRGLRELDISCSAHIVTREQTSDSQMAKQVTVALLTIPMEHNVKLRTE
jgi:hypothetical protein